MADDVEVVDLGIVEIFYSGGHKELETVDSVTPGGSDPKTPVKTMTRKRRAIGVSRGVPDFTIELGIRELLGEPEVNWVMLRNTNESFVLVVEEGDGGMRTRYKGCHVGEVSKPVDKDGEATYTVSIVALDEKQEPVKAA